MYSVGLPRSALRSESSLRESVDKGPASRRRTFESRLLVQFRMALYEALQQLQLMPHDSDHTVLHLRGGARVIIKRIPRPVDPTNPLFALRIKGVAGCPIWLQGSQAFSFENRRERVNGLWKWLLEHTGAEPALQHAMAV